jgi:L-ascorbate metabolism protein UlaG (beta-lactamase superfamily)
MPTEITYYGLGAFAITLPDDRVVLIDPCLERLNPVSPVAVPSMHTSAGLAPDGKWLAGAPMGFIVYAADNCRIYHSGDTALFSDLKLIGQLYRPTIGLLCAAMQDQAYYVQNGMLDFYGNEMSGEEGALAAMWLNVEYAICCHYLDRDGSPDVEKFFAVLKTLEGPKPLALKPGETFVYPPPHQP